MIRVGVTMGVIPKRRVGVHEGYLEGLHAVGGSPVLWPSILGRGSDAACELLAKEYVSSVDAIVLTGGGDVSPHLYGEEEVHESVYGVEEDRDRFEIAITLEAQRQGKRVLAVCRGVQVLNVANGGTIIQDVEAAGFDNHSRMDMEYGIAHAITIESDSLLAQLLPDVVGVNSLHHQALGRIGEGLRSAATTDDGLVEAVEGEFSVGVQWHPERMLECDPREFALFQWVVYGRKATSGPLD
ncbi:MAG: gamma-glutamyl-gamma-aminobutyrate hydrolase family protein [Ferrimicrobium sp.]